MASVVMKRYLSLALLVIASLVGAEKQDIHLTDGRVLKSARIISIEEKQVSIVHAGGVVGVSPEAVPLDVLARAHMALEATASERKKKEAETIAKVSERSAADKENHDEEIQLRLALAAAREGSESVAPRTPATDREAKLFALKAAFPPMRREKLSIRGDNIDIEIPASDVWTYYNSMIQTTTLQALPVTLKRVEARIESDLIQYAKRKSRTDKSTNAQAQKSTEWLKKNLKPFLAELRSLLN